MLVTRTLFVTSGFSLIETIEIIFIINNIVIIVEYITSWWKYLFYEILSIRIVLINKS